MLIEDNIPMPSERPTSLATLPPLPETHTIRQTMHALNCGHSTLYRLFAQPNELTPMKIGSKTLVLGLREFLERKAAEARQIKPA